MTPSTNQPVRARESRTRADLQKRQRRALRQLVRQFVEDNPECAVCAITPGPQRASVGVIFMDGKPSLDCERWLAVCRNHLSTSKYAHAYAR